MLRPKQMEKIITPAIEVIVEKLEEEFRVDLTGTAIRPFIADVIIELSSRQVMSSYNLGYVNATQNIATYLQHMLNTIQPIESDQISEDGSASDDASNASSDQDACGVDPLPPSENQA